MEYPEKRTIASYENPDRGAATLSDTSKISLRNRQVESCL